MDVFRVSGTFWMGDERRPFTLDVVVASADAATDRVYSLLGSRHRADRRHITIDKVDKIPPLDVTDPILKHKLGAS